MAILAVIIGSLCMFVWHGLAAYPACAGSEAIETRDDAITHSMTLWDKRRRSLTTIDDDDRAVWEMVESEDFHRISSENWLVSSEPIFLNNRVWYVRYWGGGRHISVADEFDQCRMPVKPEYYRVYDTISRMAW